MQAGAAHAGHKSIHHITAAEQLPLPVMEARLYLDTPEELLTTSNNPIDCSSSPCTSNDRQPAPGTHTV